MTTAPPNIRDAVDGLARSLERLLPQVDAVLADDWGADIHGRLREYAVTVLEDLKSGRFDAIDHEALAHLSELGADLTFHQTLMRWDLGPEWASALRDAEEASLRLRAIVVGSRRAESP